MAIVAQGQISIVDLHDMPPIQAHLEANKSKLLVKSRGGVITPSITTSDAMVVSAELYESGSTKNLLMTPNGIGENGRIIGITWTVIKGSEMIDELNYSKYGISKATPSGGFADSQLKITSPNTFDPNLTIQAVIDYRYTGMTGSTPITVDIDFSMTYHGTDGVDAYAVSLSNTAHIFPVNPTTGILLPNTTTTSKVQVFQGANEVRDFSISAGSYSNLFIVQIDNNTKIITIGVNNAIAYRIKAAGAPETEQGVIPFTVTVGGQRHEVSFSWAISSKGVNGQDSTSYWLVPSHTIVQRTCDNSGNWTFSTPTITLEAKQQRGETPVSNMTSPTFNTTLRDGNGNQIGSVITGSTINLNNDNIRRIEVKLLKDSILVDMETIAIQVVEKDSVTISLISDTKEVKNQTGVANLTLYVYRNGQDVSTLADKRTIRWFEGTSNSPITSLNDKNTHRVDGSSITNFITFRVEVTVQGQVYKDTLTIIDMSDPIMVDIFSSKGTQFLNGQGDTQLTANLWQNGSLIDIGPTDFKYTYTWKKTDKDGVTDSSFVKTGKTIAVNSSEVTRKANFICEVSR